MQKILITLLILLCTIPILSKHHRPHYDNHNNYFGRHYLTEEEHKNLKYEQKGYCKFNSGVSKVYDTYVICNNGFRERVHK